VTVTDSVSFPRLSNGSEDSEPSTVTLVVPGATLSPCAPGLTPEISTKSGSIPLPNAQSRKVGELAGRGGLGHRDDGNGGECEHGGGAGTGEESGSFML